MPSTSRHVKCGAPRLASGDTAPVRLRRMNPPGVHEPSGQYSHATTVPPAGTWLTIAGQAGIDPQGHLLEGFDAQMHQAFINLMSILEHAGMTAHDLVHVNYFLTNANYVERMRQIRRAYLPDPPPSSTTLIVAGLVVPDWLVEVDGIAVRFNDD